jgi:hypothetical protein
MTAVSAGPRVLSGPGGGAEHRWEQLPRATGWDGPPNHDRVANPVQQAGSMPRPGRHDERSMIPRRTPPPRTHMTPSSWARRGGSRRPTSSAGSRPTPPPTRHQRLAATVSHGPFGPMIFSATAGTWAIHSGWSQGGHTGHVQTDAPATTRPIDTSFTAGTASPRKIMSAMRPRRHRSVSTRRIWIRPQGSAPRESARRSPSARTRRSWHSATAGSSPGSASATPKPASNLVSAGRSHRGPALPSARVGQNRSPVAVSGVLPSLALGAAGGLGKAAGSPSM